MVEKIGSHEKESCLGLSTLEMAQRIVDGNPKIKTVSLRPYYYIPDEPSGSGDKTYLRSRDEFLRMKQTELNEWCDNLGQGFNIALDSNIVLCGGNRAHFIMADLAPSISDENLQKIKERFRKVILPRFGGGFFLETKKSYHFIGENIVSQEEWYESLGRLLITSIVAFVQEGVPRQHEVVVDYRYVGHSLIRGSTGLRLTTNGNKTVSPCVVGFI